MNCAEYRDRVAADVDGVADDEARLHGESCPDCRALRADVESVRLLLKSHRGVSAPPHVRERVHALIEDERRLRASRRRRRAVALTFSLAAVIVAAVGISWVGRAASSDLEVEVYRRLLAGTIPLAVRTSEVSELERFFAGHSSRSWRTVLDLSPAGFRLLGGRVESSPSHPVRAALYGDSVAAVVCDLVDLASYRGPLPEPGRALFLKSGGLSFCIRRMGGQVCILASAMPLERFKERMRSYVAVDSGGKAG